MFVASRVYNYATGANAALASSSEPTPANTRVKRHPRKTNAPASYASVAAGESATVKGAPDDGSAAHVNAGLAAQDAGVRSAVEAAKIAVIDEIVRKEDLYDVLGVKRNAKTDEIRRGFLNRSRVCHPDKLPNYAPCVVAFQKVSFAYQTLSKPSSRRMYDVSGRSDLAAALNGGGPSSGSGLDASGLGSEETLNGVLYSVFCEFLEGDFEMIRVLVSALNEGNPGLNIGEEAVDSIEGAFRRLREMMLAGKKYLGVVRFELIRLYEIQHSLRQLSYFDVFGRLRLTLQLARVTLSIPMAIDEAMKEPEDEQGGERQGDNSGAADTSVKEEDGKPNGAQNGGEEDDGDADESDTSDGSSSSTEEGDNGGAGRSDDGKTLHSRQHPDQHRPRHYHRDRSHNHRRRHRKPSVEDFGMRDDDDEEETDEDVPRGFAAADDESIGLFGTTNAKGRRRASRKARRRARIEERQRIKLEAQQTSLQRRGLLGPTAAGLLKGVVQVLETSESWVPGGGRNGGGSGD